MIDPETIVRLYTERVERRQPMLERRLEVLDQYNGETKVPMPELDRAPKPSVANLLALGLDQFAQRIASVLPEIVYPSLRDGFDTWDEKARQSRLATKGWWDMNRMALLAYKRARFLLAFSGAPVSIHPVSANPRDKREIPHWRVRNPLHTYPAVPDDDMDMEPADYIVRHEYPLWWLRDRYPGQMALLYTGKDTSPDRLFEVLEYNDENETVLVVVGSRPEQEPRDYGMTWQEAKPTGAPSVVLERSDNRAGICLMVWPGRIVLDKPVGHFDAMLHLFTSQARMAAYEELGIFRSIFPEQWIQGHPQDPRKPAITRDADGKNGTIGVIEHGQLVTIATQPGPQVPTAIDRLERAARLAGGVPAEFGGESPSNIRTARRGADVLSSTVDMPMQEYQQILGSSYELENLRAVKVMKAYFGSKPSSFYIPKDGKVPTAPGSTYVPNDIFVSEVCIATYAFPGSDAASIPIEIGQRVGTKEMSLQTAREMDPSIDDPIGERDRVEVEGLTQALLAGLENQLAQGGLDPIVVAKIAKRKLETHGNLPDIYVEIHEEMQRAQAEAQQAAGQAGGPPGMEPGGTPGQPPGQPLPGQGQQPGAAVPPGQAGNPQGQPSIPPAPGGTQNLADLVGMLRPANA